MKGRAPSWGAHGQGVSEGPFSILHPWRVTSLLQAPTVCLLLLLLILLLLLPMAGEQHLLVPGLTASPAACDRVGVGGTPVHLLLSGASGNLPFVLTAVLQAAAQRREG